MQAGSLMLRALNRIKRKLASIAPLLLVTLVLFAALTLLAFVAEPFLPESLRQFLANLRNGDTATARDVLTRWHA